MELEHALQYPDLDSRCTVASVHTVIYWYQDKHYCQGMQLKFVLHL